MGRRQKQWVWWTLENVLGCNGCGRNVEGIILFRRLLDLSEGKIDGASKDFK